MVSITKELHNKLRALVSGIDTEVAGFLVGDVENTELILKDIIIPDQEASGADVEFKEDDLLKLRTSLSDDDWKRIVGHFHSHVRMGVFWSGTDETMIAQMSKTRKRTVFIVGSIKENNFETLTRVVLNDPFRLDMDKVELKIVGDDQEKEFVAKAKEKIKKATYQYTYPRGNYHGYGYNGYEGRGYEADYERIYEYYNQSHGTGKTDSPDWPWVYSEKNMVIGENISDDLKEALEKKYDKWFAKGIVKWFKTAGAYSFKLEAVDVANADKIVSILDVFVDKQLTDTRSSKNQIEEMKEYVRD